MTNIFLEKSDAIKHSTNNSSNDSKKTSEVLIVDKNEKCNAKKENDHDITTTAVLKSPPSNHEDKDFAVPVSSGFSNKLSRQRVSVHQQTPATQLLSQQHSISSNDSNNQQMETSLMFVRNPNLTNEMRPPLTCATSEAPVSSMNCSMTTSSPMPPVHGSNAAKSSLLATRPSATNLLSSTSSANTYAAALAAAISSRGNTERSEGLVRGPLGMPMHVLAASSSTYALPASAPSVCLVKPSTSAPLPTPTTAPSILTSTPCQSMLDQPCIPGQVAYELPIGNTLTTVPNLNPKSSEPNYSSTNLKFPATSILSSTYSGSSSTLSPSSLVGSTSFVTSPPSLPTSVSKYEPELLLSPAKLGQ